MWVILTASVWCTSLTGTLYQLVQLVVPVSLVYYTNWFSLLYQSHWYIIPTGSVCCTSLTGTLYQLVQFVAQVSLVCCSYFFFYYFYPLNLLPICFYHTFLPSNRSITYSSNVFYLCRFVDSCCQPSTLLPISGRGICVLLFLTLIWPESNVLISFVLSISFSELYEINYSYTCLSSCGILDVFANKYKVDSNGFIQYPFLLPSHTSSFCVIYMH